MMRKWYSTENYFIKAWGRSYSETAGSVGGTLGRLRTNTEIMNRRLSLIASKVTLKALIDYHASFGHGEAIVDLLERILRRIVI